MHILQRMGEWPSTESGELVDAPGETWKAIGMALVTGGRGLPGGASLARLLAEHRGRRNVEDLPPLTIDQISRVGRFALPADGSVADSRIWFNTRSSRRNVGRNSSGVERRRHVAVRADLLCQGCWPNTEAGRTGRTNCISRKSRY